MTKEAAEDILELPRRYGKDDVRRAHAELARRYHPDAIAQKHYDPQVAEASMVEVNKAYDLLKRQFVGAGDLVVERASSSIAAGFAGVDWRVVEDVPNDADDPWAFVDEWGVEPPPERVPLSVRSVLLGPQVLRVAFVISFGWLWWHAFPLLPHNLNRFIPDGSWTMFDVARLVAAMVYPTYLLVYEFVSGYVSGFVREVLNGLVSFITGTYVDLRSHTSSYGCALYKLIHEQVYALLMAPVVLYLVAWCVEVDAGAMRIVIGVLAALLGIDALAACVRGGFVNVWSAALADRVEDQYLLIRARLLMRCGKWGGRS